MDICHFLLKEALFLAFNSDGASIKKPHIAIVLMATLSALGSAPHWTWQEKKPSGGHEKCLCEASFRQHECPWSPSPGVTEAKEQGLVLRNHSAFGNLPSILIQLKQRLYPSFQTPQRTSWRKRSWADIDLWCCRGGRPGQLHMSRGEQKWTETCQCSSAQKR